MFMRKRRVPVRNRERAVAFYSQLLGIDLERQSNSPLTFEESVHDVPALLHVNVADRLEDALAFVWSNGGRVLEAEPRETEYHRRALVMDCEGNHLALYSN